MMRRSGDISTLTCPQTVRERDGCDELKTRLGIASDANLVRVALVNLALRIEPNLDTSLWRVRGLRDRVTGRRDPRVQRTA